MAVIPLLESLEAVVKDVFFTSSETCNLHNKSIQRSGADFQKRNNAIFPSHGEESRFSKVSFD